MNTTLHNRAFRLGSHGNHGSLWVILATAALASGCGGEHGSSSANPDGGPSGNGGAAGATGSAVSGGASTTSRSEAQGGSDEGAGSGCIAARDIPDDAFADTNCDGIDGDASAAIFVSPGGDDTGDGTQIDPVRSVGRAVSLAQRDVKDVYVCTGTYTERVVIETDGVSIYGGYDCETWGRSNDARPRIESATGPALELRELTGPFVFDRVDFTALDATDYGQSSLAVLVVSSTDITFSRSRLTAGDGGPGVPVAAFANVTATPPVGETGQDSPLLFCVASNDPSPICATVPNGGGEPAGYFLSGTCLRYSTPSRRALSFRHRSSAGTVGAPRIAGARSSRSWRW